MPFFKVMPAVKLSDHPKFAAFWEMIGHHIRRLGYEIKGVQNKGIMLHPGTRDLYFIDSQGTLYYSERTDVYHPVDPDNFTKLMEKMNGPKLETILVDGVMSFLNEQIKVHRETAEDLENHKDRLTNELGRFIATH